MGKKVITWRTDWESSMEKEVFSIFQILFLQYFLVAGLHISLSDILDKKIGLIEKIFNYLVIQVIMSIINYALLK
jgi:hypothetical protein